MNGYCFLIADSVNTTSQVIQSNDSMIGQLIFVLVMFVIVVSLAYFSIKFIGKSGFTSSTSANMKIIHVLKVGYNSSIQLVKVGEQYFLLGVTKDRVEFLSEVDKDNAVSMSEQVSIEKGSFEKYLKKFLNKDNSPK